MGHDGRDWHIQFINSVSDHILISSDASINCFRLSHLVKKCEKTVDLSGWSDAQKMNQCRRATFCDETQQMLINTEISILFFSRQVNEVRRFN